MPTKRVCHRGFTILELVIVIAIISVMAVFATLNWPSSVLSLDAQAEATAQDIRYIQHLAMSRNQRYRINLCRSALCAPPPVALQAYGYFYSDLSGTPVDHPGTSPLGPRISLAGGVTLTWSLAILPNSYIVFDGKGIPYNDTTGTELTADAELTLTSPSGDIKIVRVRAETGSVSVN